MFSEEPAAGNPHGWFCYPVDGITELIPIKQASRYLITNVRNKPFQ